MPAKPALTAVLAAVVPAVALLANRDGVRPTVRAVALLVFDHTAALCNSAGVSSISTQVSVSQVVQQHMVQSCVCVLTLADLASAGRSKKAATSSSSSVATAVPLLIFLVLVVCM
jgi:hypothetical protein